MIERILAGFIQAADRFNVLFALEYSYAQGAKPVNLLSPIFEACDNDMLDYIYKHSRISELVLMADEMLDALERRYDVF